MEWMFMPLRRYADFQGRSRRTEYWMFVLFTILVNIGFAVLMLLAGGSALLMGGSTVGVLAAGGVVGIVYIINLIFTLALFIPSLAVSVRRLHDTNRSGWWLLGPILAYAGGLAAMLVGVASTTASGTAESFAAIAIIGGIIMFGGFILAIVLLVFLCLPGTVGPNRFGSDPKNAEANLGEVFS